jgi:hypothetical protein
MSFDLSVWHEDQPITAKEAGEIYVRLGESDGRLVKAYPITYFHEDVGQCFPPFGANSDEDLDNCPWNCAWDIGAGWVDFAIAWSRAAELAPMLIELANAHDLICCDPRRGELYLPVPLLGNGN